MLELVGLELFVGLAVDDLRNVRFGESLLAGLFRARQGEFPLPGAQLDMLPHAGAMEQMIAVKRNDILSSLEERHQADLADEFLLVLLYVDLIPGKIFEVVRVNFEDIILLE